MLLRCMDVDAAALPHYRESRVHRLVSHARSDHVSNITVSKETNPHLFGGAAGGTESEPRDLSNSGRTEESGSRDFSRSAAMDMITAEGERKKGWVGAG
ncbi:hypothetical protein JOQ06_029369 [Pogonophryne albipinna]|uniref:Uncharacterized protein n=1 Tax=Pogonophryne albipinna TaxID=1090488 RepID=A0AAD6BAQ5_9TELE|nr:hypothetical protein JOQ06_029369 [Pogonophryne albipinna]